MNRQERDRYDYGRYEGYNNDEHYHAARNLTDEFEQHYRSERGTGYDNDRNRPVRSYHEGSEIDDTYNRHNSMSQNFRGRSGYMGQNRDTDSDTNYFRHYNDNQDNYRGDEDFYREDRGNDRQFTRRGTSSSFSDDYGSYNRDRYSGSGDQDYNYGSGNGFRNVRFIPDSDERDNYRSGATYSGNYSSGQDDRYNRDQDHYRTHRWYDEDDRNRYY